MELDRGGLWFGVGQGGCRFDDIGMMLSGLFGKL
jgi:hypothetical protein